MYGFGWCRLLSAQRIAQLQTQAERSRLGARVSGSRRVRRTGNQVAGRWRYSAISLGLALFVLFWLLVPAWSGVDEGLSVRIVDLQRAGAIVRVDLRVAGIEPDGQMPEVALQADLERHPVRAVVPFRMPSQFSMDIDLKAGKVRVGDVSVGEFKPVSPPGENIQFPIQVTVTQGSARSTDRRLAVLPLPTVIVPGYLNDLGGTADPNFTSALARRGYQTSGQSPDLFWFTYSSRRLSIEDGARALARYVRSIVLSSTYASRINVIGYSLGGLLARWDIAFEPGWGRLVNRLILVGVPHEGAVSAYLYAHYPVAGLARTPAARGLVPTFPFWRPTAGSSWAVPPDAHNAALAALNIRPLPDPIRAYAVYATGQTTAAGITGDPLEPDIAYGPGDGIVLAASALGLPINGGTGITALAGRLVAQIDLGPIRHQELMAAAAAKIGEALLDRFSDDSPSRPNARLGSFDELGFLR